MSLAHTELRFESPQAARRWFGQLRAQWVVTGTSIATDPTTGAIIGAADFAVTGGRLVPVPRDEAEHA